MWFTESSYERPRSKSAVTGGRSWQSMVPTCSHKQGRFPNYRDPIVTITVRRSNRHLPGPKVAVNHIRLLCVWNRIGYALGHGQQFMSELWLVLMKFSLWKTGQVTENSYFGLKFLETRTAPYPLLVQCLAAEVPCHHYWVKPINLFFGSHPELKNWN